MHVAEQSGPASISESFVCENVDSVLQLAWIMGPALGIWTMSVLSSYSGIHNVTTGIVLLVLRGNLYYIRLLIHETGRVAPL